MGSSAQLSTGHIPDQWHVSNGIDPDGNVYDPMDDVDEGDFVEDDVFEDDDIIGAEDAEEVREHDLTLLAARSYGRKTPQQREEASARLQVSCSTSAQCKYFAGVNPIHTSHEPTCDDSLIC